MNITKVKTAPASCLKNIREVIKTPIQIKPNTVVEILNRGVDDFLNISIIIAINKIIIGVISIKVNTIFTSSNVLSKPI